MSWCGRSELLLTSIRSHLLPLKIKIKYSILRLAKLHILGLPMSWVMQGGCAMQFVSIVDTSMLLKPQVLVLSEISVITLNLEFMATLRYLTVSCFPLLSCFFHLTLYVSLRQRQAVGAPSISRTGQPTFSPLLWYHRYWPVNSTPQHPSPTTISHSTLT